MVIIDHALIKEVWNNPLLLYESEQQKRFDDEIRRMEVKSFKNLKFTKHANCLIITGSIHYLYNEGLHNANMFTMMNCINTIKKLCQDLNIDARKAIIQNLEYGMNLQLPFNLETVIRSLKYHGRNEFRFIDKIEYSKRSARFNRDNKPNSYKIIKAYAKSLQFPKYTQLNTLRFEIKSKQSKYINKLGIYTLADLLRHEVYHTLIQELKKEWQQVLLIDKITPMDIPSKYLSSDQWEDWLQGHRNTFYNQKRKYKELLSNYPGNTHQVIASLINKYALEIIDPSLSTTNKLESKIEVTSVYYNHTIA